MLADLQARPVAQINSGVEYLSSTLNYIFFGGVSVL